MVRLAWDEGLSTANDLIDGQLKRVLLSSQSWIDAPAEGDAELVEELLAFVAYHFATQEKLMRTQDMPAKDIRRHQTAHQRLLTRFRSIALRSVSSSREARIRVVSELLEHVREMDKHAQLPSLKPILRPRLRPERASTKKEYVLLPGRRQA